MPVRDDRTGLQVFRRAALAAGVSLEVALRMRAAEGVSRRKLVGAALVAGALAVVSHAVGADPRALIGSQSSLLLQMAASQAADTEADSLAAGPRPDAPRLDAP